MKRTGYLLVSLVLLIILILSRSLSVRPSVRLSKVCQPHTFPSDFSEGLDIAISLPLQYVSLHQTRKVTMEFSARVLRQRVFPRFIAQTFTRHRLLGFTARFTGSICFGKLIINKKKIQEKEQKWAHPVNTWTWSLSITCYVRKLHKYHVYGRSLSQSWYLILLWKKKMNDECSTFNLSTSRKYMNMVIEYYMLRT